MGEVVIQADHLTKIYKLYGRPSDRLREALGKKVEVREHYALKDVSFQIQKGETVGIIGTNGSGKSTILKIITGVLSQTSGSLAVNGRISALLELGAGFNMEYTGMENIYLNGTMLGFSEEEIQERLPDILAFADIGEYITQPVKMYSSGMFVRLAFAVAINIDPEILIVDEALSVGDVFFQAKCYRKFEDFKKSKKTIVFVSHDLSSISRYCDRVILLNQGEILDEGSPRDMVDLYKQVLVGQNKNASVRATATTVPQGFSKNPNCLEYGTREAVIVSAFVEDQAGRPSNTIRKMEPFAIHMTVHFQENVDDVIYAFTIKDMRGTEITGTNTMFEGIPVPPKKKGETQAVTFRQVMNLQGGDYLLSLGCTGYKNGEFVVYHRMYDLCSITVVSAKDSVGFYDMDSRITLGEGAT